MCECDTEKISAKALSIEMDLLYVGLETILFEGVRVHFAAMTFHRLGQGKG